MPFDPTKPANHSPVSSAELREQFNSLNDGLGNLTMRVDDLEDALPNNTANNVNGVAPYNLPVSNPPTQIQVQEIVNALNDLLQSLKRP